MENLLFCKQQHMTIAKMKALRSPTPLIADTLLASLPPTLSQDPSPPPCLFLITTHHVKEIHPSINNQLYHSTSSHWQLSVFSVPTREFVTCHIADRQHHINVNAFPSCTTIPYCNNTYLHLPFQQPAHIHLSWGKECLGVWLGSLPFPPV